MDWRKNSKTMWHRCLIHCLLQNIQDTIPITSGMEKPKDCQINPQEKCPAYSIGKNTHQDDPGWVGLCLRLHYNCPVNFGAKIRFLAHWVWFDIAYPAAQLARFCAFWLGSSTGQR